MKTKGADLKPFEKSPEQMAYEQAVGAWQQAVSGIVEQIMKAKGDPSKAQFPPQPTPEQFGYQPTGNNPATSQQPSPGVSQ